MSLAHVRKWLSDPSLVLETARHTFSQADIDSSGFIEANEIKGILSLLITNSNMEEFLTLPSEVALERHFETANIHKKVSLEEWTLFLKLFIEAQLVAFCSQPPVLHFICGISLFVHACLFTGRRYLVGASRPRQGVGSG